VRLERVTAYLPATARRSAAAASAALRPAHALAYILGARWIGSFWAALVNGGAGS